jgi:hypothetical protein
MNANRNRSRNGRHTPPPGLVPCGAEDSQANREDLFIVDLYELVSWVKQIQLLARFHLTPKRSLE